MGARTSLRDGIVERQDTVAAICYVGDGLHRLAKAVEMLLDPEKVQERRFEQRPRAEVVDIDETPLRRREAEGFKLGGEIPVQRGVTR